MGARATDHGHLTADTQPLDAHEASRIYAAGLAGTATVQQAQAFSAHMLFEMARMSRDDGLVMQIHPGVLRDYDPVACQAGSAATAGSTSRCRSTSYEDLRPLLNAFGHDPQFRCIVFTIDETAYSRELAPLAGAYPSMRLGAPWWFLDAPVGDAPLPGGGDRDRRLLQHERLRRRHHGRSPRSRRGTTSPAGSTAAYLAELVVRGQLGVDEAIETAVDLAVTIPRTAYAQR